MPVEAGLVLSPSPHAASLHSIMSVIRLFRLQQRSAVMKFSFGRISRKHRSRRASCFLSVPLNGQPAPPSSTHPQVTEPLQPSITPDPADMPLARHSQWCNLRPSSRNLQAIAAVCQTRTCRLRHDQARNVDGDVTPVAAQGGHAAIDMSGRKWGDTGSGSSPSSVRAARRHDLAPARASVEANQEDVAGRGIGHDRLGARAPVRPPWGHVSSPCCPAGRSILRGCPSFLRISVSGPSSGTVRSTLTG